MAEKFWFLKNCELFQSLSADQLQWLESRSRMRKFPRATPVYLPADEADGVLMLVSGMVRICSVTSEGKQTIMAFIKPGELFGELAILEMGNREDYAETVEASTVVLISAAAVRELLEQVPQLAIGITRLVGLRRRRIERRLKYLLFHSNRDRLVHLLLDLAEQYGRWARGEIDLGIRLSHQDLASVIGSTRESVTVILGQLQLEGLIRLARRRVVLRDLKSLADSVGVPIPTLAGAAPSSGTVARQEYRSVLS